MWVPPSNYTFPLSQKNEGKKGNIILQTIVEKVNDSQCFSVLADETTDISVTEQLALCVRYIDKENNVNDSFLKFIQVHSLSGKNLADSILNGKLYLGFEFIVYLLPT